MSELSLLKKINKLQRKMESLATCKGTFNHPEVVKISQKLDMLIVQYQKFKMTSYIISKQKSKLII